MKLQHLAELVNESESNVVRLTQQEKVLKEEIRKLDSFEKRQNLSIEYLKNVILKFLQSGDKEREPLVPVLTKLLYLSPTESDNLKKAVKGAAAGATQARTGLWSAS